MKKFISILLVSLFILSAASLALGAGSISVDPKTNADYPNNKIYNINMLDFESTQNSYWAKQNDAGEWEAAPVYFDEDENCHLYTELAGKPLPDGWRESYAELPYDNATMEMLSFMLYDESTPKNNLAKLDWGFTDNGEVLHVEATQSGSAGFAFTFWDGVLFEGMRVGSEGSNLMEYCKIRVRNLSANTNLTLGFNNNNINSGQYKSCPAVSISNVTMEPSSGEWQTITFSMIKANSDTNYNDSLAKNDNGVPQSRWGATLRQIYFFPFGYNAAYKGAEMDIDYIVFGSEEYVTNYKSELEKDEENVEKIELVKAPTKTTYYVGETIDLDGLEVKVTYKDGHSETRSTASTVYNFDDASDACPVTLKYGNATTTYNVKVIGIKDFAVETMPEATSYKATDIAKNGFTPTGLTVKATFDDGTTKTFALGEFKLEYDFVGSGTQTVTVNYHGARTSFQINLINVVAIEAAPLTAPIHFGEKLTTDNVEITCIYSDESKDTFANSGFDSNNVEITYEKVYGETAVTVTYTSASLEKPLTCTTTGTYAKPSSLVVTNVSAATEYELDSLFSADGLEFSLVYDDGTSVSITKDDLTKEPIYDFSSAGDKQVEFQFDDLSATLDVTVNDLDLPDTKPATSTTKKPSGGSSDGSPVVVIVIVVVAVLVVGGVVAFVVLKKKKK